MGYSRLSFPKAMNERQVMDIDELRMNARSAGLRIEEHGRSAFIRDETGNIKGGWVDTAKYGHAEAMVGYIHG